MKIRQGFVSNSSSTSFICGICGEDQSGYDTSLDDTNMQSCINDHTFCNSHQREVSHEELREHLLEYWNSDKRTKYQKGMKDETIEGISSCSVDKLETLYGSLDGEGSMYDRATIFCPCCNFEAYEEAEALTVLKGYYNITEKDILEIMKEKANEN